MEPIKCEVNVVDIDSSGDPIPLPGEDIKLSLDNEELKGLQQKDKFCKDITSELQRGSYKIRTPLLSGRRDTQKVCGRWKTKI